MCASPLQRHRAVCGSVALLIPSPQREHYQNTLFAEDESRGATSCIT
jgi:hypothetical protein